MAGQGRRNDEYWDSKKNRLEYGRIMSYVLKGNGMSNLHLHDFNLYGIKQIIYA